VLTHPAFDRPAVHNEPRRGRRKGTRNLADARRERDRERGQMLVGSQTGAASSPSPPTPIWQSSASDLPPRDLIAPPRLRHEDAVVGAALAILEGRMREPAGVYEHPLAVKDFLCLHLGGLDRESFGVMFLDVRARLITFEVLFTGTLTHTPVHPREVARRALQLNAAAVILVHNHPSGVAEPSRADELITAALRQSLQLIDVRVLDHVIVAGVTAMSFSERGLL
jgi:DNA repair protein RadC